MTVDARYDCQSGKSASLYRKSGAAYVKPSRQKYFSSVFRKIMVDYPRPGPARGAYASSRTWAGDAMDADARNDEARGADGEIVWSRSPDAGIKSCGTFRRATAANKPGTPRRSRISRNPLRRECRCFGGTCVACVRRVHTFLHARLAGAASIRHSLRPLDLGVTNEASLGHSCRGNAKSRPLRCRPPA
jgi:hypothetical protein